MATIKSYTSLEQSRKLAKILPIESADMHYQQIIDVDTKEIRNVLLEKDFVIVVNDDKPIVTPAWSLSALLSVIPKPDLVQNSEGTWLLHSWVNDYPWSVGGYSNPVDACYELILKLHELKKL